MTTQKTVRDQFYDLTPERVLVSAEQFGVRCTGRCLALNSMENRVYELELDEDPPAFRVAKFYRPGRWTRAQIQAEHDFLKELVEAEVPVVAPLPATQSKPGIATAGDTILQTPDIGVFVALFPKARGRNPEDLTEEQFEWIGRLIARMHLVGARAQTTDRITLNAQTFVFDNLAFLLKGGFIPPDVRSAYERIAQQIGELYAANTQRLALQRIHGDCHRGNILWGPDGPFFVDFDDMVMGPVVQDLWLLISGREEEGMRQREAILYGYEQLRDFDRRQLRLIEGLRALRYINYAAWIARRWEDPTFKRIFTDFGSVAYWQGQVNDLQEQLELFSNELER